MSNVILNSWNGREFENDNRCMVCNSLSTTIEYEILGYYETWLNICKNCLLNMANEIDIAVLKSKTYGD